MSSNENFHIIENLGLIIVSHNDILNQESIETIISGLISNPFFKHKYNVLIDVRSSEITLTSEEIEMLSNFVYNNLKEIGIKKFALLASASQTNKAAEFVSNYRQSSRYQAFSSIDAALYWLGIPIERKPQIKIKLRYLKEIYAY
jgi:hypothetical protein